MKVRRVEEAPVGGMKRTTHWGCRAVEHCGRNKATAALAQFKAAHRVWKLTLARVKEPLEEQTWWDVGDQIVDQISSQLPPP